MQRRKMTIRTGIVIAIEGLKGDPFEWTATVAQRETLRRHVMPFVHDYALARGIELTDADIESELGGVIHDLRMGRSLAEIGRDEITEEITPVSAP